MKWEGHQAITRAVARTLPLSEQDRDALVDAVTEPDETRGEYESHHTGKTQETLDYLVHARAHHLRGEPDAAVAALAYALHYVQDGCFPPSGSLEHNSIEKAATGSEVTYHVRNHMPTDPPITYQGVAEMVHGLGPQANAPDAVHAAVEASFALARAVFGPSQAPPGLLERARKEVRRQYTRWLPASLLAGTGLGLLASLALKLSLPLAIGLSLGAMVIVLLSHRSYYVMLGELKWFQPVSEGKQAARSNDPNARSTGSPQDDDADEVVPF